MAVSEPVEVFYAYARADEGLRKELERHLSTLRRQGYISEWHEEMIEAGAVREQEVNRHLLSAGIILLLVSADFIDSDYCYGVEVQEAMRRQRAGEAVVMPIILRPCDWKNTPFEMLQVLPRDGRAVTLQPNEDQEFTEIAKELRQVIERLNRGRTANGQGRGIQYGQGSGEVANNDEGTNGRGKRRGSGYDETMAQGGKQSEVGKSIGEENMENRNTLMGIKRTTVSTSTGGVQKALLA